MKKDNIVLNIDGVKYPLKYGYGTTKLLGREWKLPGMMEVFAKVIQMMPFQDPEKVDLENVSEEENAAIGAEMLKFENIDIMIDIVQAGILHGNPDLKELPIDNDGIADHLFSNMEDLTDVFGAFLASMPRPKATPEPQKKRSARAKKKTA